MGNGKKGGGVLRHGVAISRSGGTGGGAVLGWLIQEKAMQGMTA